MIQMGPEQLSSAKHEVGASDVVSTPENRKGNADSSGIYEEIPPILHGRWSNLSVEIPSKNLEDSSPNTYMKINMPPTPISTSIKSGRTPGCSPLSSRISSSPSSSPSRGSTSVRKFLSRLSFRCEVSASEILKKDAVLVQDASPATQQESLSYVFGPLSFAKLFRPTVRTTLSLPASPAAQEFRRCLSRSASAPSNAKSRSIRRLDSFGLVFRVIPSTPRVVSLAQTALNSVRSVENGISGSGEDGPEGDAVCRICLMEVDEGGETLKMECRCKGELALAHRECAAKWFSIKGNKNCEVCKQEVQNLPVTLIRLQNTQPPNSRSGRRPWTILNSYRNWHDVPILVIASILAYFCFLEQLLVADDGFAAMAITVPFSGLLGFLSSLTSATMVRKGYTFAYASVQFALVVIFTHVFYSLRHMQAVVSIMLATFAGLGVAMGASSVVVEFLRWRCGHGLSQPQYRNPRPPYSSANQLSGNVHQQDIAVANLHDLDSRSLSSSQAT